MGLLSLGKPLSWEEIKANGYDEHIRRHGLIQFVSLYNKLKDRPCDVLKWGDEVEYMLVKLDHENKSAKLLLKAEEILPTLQEQEENNPKGDLKTLWRPEYAAYMVEGTPGKPYGGLMAHLNTVEANMKFRRQEVEKLLDTAKGETALSLTAFPRLGCPSFSTPSYKPNPSDEGVSKSLFIPDEVIYPGHPRFRSLTKNIRKRRGEKVAINIPIFKDKNTPTPFVEEFVNDHDGEGARAAKPDHVYMDCMGFGMGNSCLQMTFQACHINEARHLYDQLTPLCPIILALSAASPIYKGYLTDHDCRWNVIAGSVDDRTPEERNLEPLKNNKFVIPKSRYDSIDSYLSPNGERYSDIDLVLDERDCQELMDKGIDRQLARHIAHLFIRDPVSVFAEMIDQDDSKDSDHFENIQSTNWQTMRFKPPPVNSNIGWRVEFRPIEVQLTDFENAAFVVFVVLLTRTILTFKLNLLMQLSKVDLNMQQAQKRNAILNSKFYFRKDLQSCACDCPIENEQCLMSINTIINGGPLGDGQGDFPGLIPLINQYLASVETDLDTRCTIMCYLKLISDRASGKLQTLAAWIRDFVDSHPEYKHDSVVTDRINYDLVTACDQITKGQMTAPELFHCTESKSSNDIPNSVKVAQEIV
ncbi:glutamate--cysteine ligase catalytic subunit-like [Patiria miniata]|uniref:Glutamate--cysteine ligase n=1 Tax=Patiria miniata TaxID=46514 RepID=A0A913ZKX9_PATMI|nr:glutamate--cysteine ligase catalytic subunit-like [Patiria miniata]